MTIFDSYLILLNFFRANDLFTLNKHYKDLLLVNENTENENKNILTLALLQMEKEEIIKLLPHLFGEDKSWVLIKKLAQWQQTVTISGELCLAITNVLNRYCDYVKNETEKPNPLAITAQDLVNLVIILESLLKQPVKETL